MQLGVAACAVILILREVRALIPELRTARKNGNGANRPVTSGEKPPEYWQREFRTAAAEAFSTTAMPALNQQTEILREIREGQKDLSNEVLKLAARQAGRGRGR